MEYDTSVSEAEKNPQSYGLQCVYQDQSAWPGYQCPRMPPKRRNHLVWGCCDLKPESQFDCRYDKTIWPHEGGPYESAGHINGNPNHRHCLRCNEDECTHDDFRCWNDPGYEEFGWMDIDDDHCAQYMWENPDSLTARTIGGSGRPGVPDDPLTWTTLCHACHILDEPVEECRTGWEQLCLLSLHELNRFRCEKKCNAEHCKSICNRNELDYAGDTSGLDGEMNIENPCTWTNVCLAKCVPRRGAARWDETEHPGIVIDRVEHRGYLYETVPDIDGCGYDIGNPCRLRPLDDGTIDYNGSNVTFNIRHFCPIWNGAVRRWPGLGYLVAVMLIGPGWVL